MFFKILYKVLNLPRKIYLVLIKGLIKEQFKSCGKNVRFSAKISGNLSNIEIGNNVYIGVGAHFLCSRAKITIGDHVMFGSNVTVITGDHRYDVLGKYMDEITDADKLPENDLPVIFQGDNWVGANSTILKGVVVGKGAIISAGSVCTKNIPPYSIVGGVPAKVIKMRFTEDEIKLHEEKLSLNN